MGFGTGPVPAAGAFLLGLTWRKGGILYGWHSGVRVTLGDPRPRRCRGRSHSRNVVGSGGPGGLSRRGGKR